MIPSPPGLLSRQNRPYQDRSDRNDEIFGDRPIAPKNALFCMAACAFLWSTSGALIKLVRWNGMAIAGMRSLIAGVVLLAYLKLVGKKLVVNRLTLTVGFAVMLKFVCFTVGNKLTSSANMVALQYTNPVFVLIFSMLFFGQRFPAQGHRGSPRHGRRYCHADP